jgi:dihydroflavonol-4-reductase
MLSSAASGEERGCQERTMKPSVLVTGANGYTGGNFCRFLAERDVPTRAMYYTPEGEPRFAHPNLEFVPGDLRDRDSLRQALEGIEVVYNIAALYRPTNVSDRQYYEVNVDGVLNMVELAAQAGVRRFVQCSTIGVHGHVHNPPANENTPPKPDDYYQFTKLEGEKLSLERGRELRLSVSVIRPAAIYGPLEDRFLKLPKLLQRGRFIMFGDGEVLYHFIHINDLCDAFVLAAERPEAVGEVFIIADDHAITLNKIIAIMCDELGVPQPRIRLPYATLWVASAICEFACKPFGVSPPLHRRRAHWFSSTRSFDVSKARNKLGYVPKVSVEDGLRQMVRSYVEAGWLRSTGGRADFKARAS